MTTCPVCQRDFSNEAKSCPYCGVVFAKLKPRSQTTPTESVLSQQGPASESRPASLSSKSVAQQHPPAPGSTLLWTHPAVFLLLILLVVAGSWYGYVRYEQAQLIAMKQKEQAQLLTAKQKEQSQLLAAMQKMMGKDQGYTESILKIETDPAGFSYKELFDLFDQSIKGRSELIIEARGLLAGKYLPVSEPLLAFLEAENTWTRAKQLLYRTEFTLTVEGKQSWDDYFGKIEHYRKVDTLAQDYESAANAFQQAYEAMLGHEEALSHELGAQQVVFLPLFARYRESNMGEVGKAITIAGEAKERARLNLQPRRKPG